MPRYVKGYICDHDMIRNFLGANFDNDDKATQNTQIDGVVWETMVYLRERSQTRQDTYSFSIVHEIGDVHKTFRALSMDPECFGLESLDEKNLREKPIEFPSTFEIL